MSKMKDIKVEVHIFQWKLKHWNQTHNKNDCKF
jgi:hypothetical protein